LLSARFEDTLPNPEQSMGAEEQSAENRAFVKGDTTFMRRPIQKLPLDLTEWVPPSILADWVNEAVAKLDSSTPEAQEFAQSASELRGILRAVLYGYATQVYPSKDIVAACHTDRFFKLMCEGKPIFPDELERFRRTHRSLLESLLGQIFVRAVSEKFANVGQLPPGFQHSLLRRAIDSIDTARHMDREE